MDDQKPTICLYLNLLIGGGGGYFLDLISRPELMAGAFATSIAVFLVVVEQNRSRKGRLPPSNGRTRGYGRAQWKVKKSVRGGSERPTRARREIRAYHELVQTAKTMNNIGALGRKLGEGRQKTPKEAYTLMVERRGSYEQQRK